MLVSSIKIFGEKCNWENPLKGKNARENTNNRITIIKMNIVGIPCSQDGSSI